MTVTFPLRDCIRGCGRRFYPRKIAQRVCGVCIWKWVMNICPDCGHDGEDDLPHAADCGKRAEA